MNKVLEYLIELGNIDQRLMDIEEIKGDLPEKVKQMENELTQLETENKANSERISEIGKILRQNNANIDECIARLEKYKKHLYLVTSNKEYDALTTEIDSTKSAINEFEEQMIQIEEEKINLQDKIKSNNMRTKELTGKMELSRGELKSAISETEAEQADLEARREKVVSHIDKPYLNNYNKLRIARDGVGVVAISRNACAECYNHLPPQTIIEVKQNNSIITCPNCGVFLYWDNVEDDI